MPDLMATGPDPGSTYTPNSGVYREDRSIAATGQMFRAYGAAFNSVSNTWSIQAGASAAYATVQDTNGNIHYYTLDVSTGTWVGSDNKELIERLPHAVKRAEGEPQVIVAQGSTEDGLAAMQRRFGSFDERLRVWIFAENATRVAPPVFEPNRVGSSTLRLTLA